jgi:site-specific DNA-methyltransferase (adenine-specific)
MKSKKKYKTSENKRTQKLVVVEERDVKYTVSAKEYELGLGKLLQGDCTELLGAKLFGQVDLTFLDPPFNQNKDYAEHDDDMPAEKYWDWMFQVCRKIFELTSTGGAIYFMQREKNTEEVLNCLRESGWSFQNLIIWKKKTSAVPGISRFGKQYQIVAFATKGKTPRLFHRLRIEPPLPPGYKYQRENGMFVTDVWDEIRELTSGYFAGDEPLRDKQGQRLHKQQSPVELLTRIILSSSKPGDTVMDPFAGTGTTLIVANQLGRKSISIELDAQNISVIKRRFSEKRVADNASRFFSHYKCTPDIKNVWGNKII